VARIDSQYFQGRVPSWNDLTRHPNWDEHWRSRNVAKDLDRVPARLPVLNVAGWFDAEDFYGPMTIYSTLEKLHPVNRSTIVVGPWLHGGWVRMDGDELGNIRFGTKTSLTFQREMQFPFFERHLRNGAASDLPEAWVFETGANEWRRYDTWPPKVAGDRQIYFRERGKLAFEPPSTRAAADSGFDAYVSDPAKPVPFSMEPRTTQGHLWMVEDQRFAAMRPDVLVYETDPLTEDITIAGPIAASLDISTTGTDGDWVVKLIDVYPGNAPDNVPNPAGVRMGGFQMLVAGEVMRAKFRDDPSKPKPLVPGEITRLEFGLHDKLHTFKKGHRIMVQVQSSWFPVIDRNPQRFVDIMRATDGDFQKATQRVWRTPQSPSHLQVKVLRPIVP
jgi:putative CocE/NonD family hydrolase